MTDRHVVVLAGGLTHERDVSLRSGSRIARRVAPQRPRGDRAGRGRRPDPLAGRDRPDAAIVALHGGRGENGAVQGILQMAGIPYVGTPSQNCRLAWDKNIAKNLVSRAGFSHPEVDHAVARHVPGSRRAATDRACWSSYLGLPLMIKPHHGGSALGATAVRIGRGPAGRAGRRLRLRRRSWWSRSSSGTELAITVIDDADGARALPAVEIVLAGDIFDYESRYTAGLTTYHTPARVDPTRSPPRPPISRSARIARSACATCPAPMPSSTPTASSTSWRSTSPPA